MVKPIELCRYFAVCVVWVVFIATTTVVIVAASHDGCEVQLNLYLLPIPFYILVIEETKIKKKFQKLFGLTSSFQKIMLYCIVIAILPIAPQIVQSWIECREHFGVWIYILDIIIGFLYLVYGLLKGVSALFTSWQKSFSYKTVKKQKEEFIAKSNSLNVAFNEDAKNNNKRKNKEIAECIRQNFFELFQSCIHFKATSITRVEAETCSFLLHVRLFSVKDLPAKKRACSSCERTFNKGAFVSISPCCQRLHHLLCMAKQLVGKLECEFCREEFEYSLNHVLISEANLRINRNSIFLSEFKTE